MTHPEQALADIIERCQPQTLLACGKLAQALAQSWCEEREDTLLTGIDEEDIQGELSLSRTQDLALVTLTLEHLSHAQGQTFLGQLRNYGTRQIAVLEADSSGWTLSNFIGLGFKRQARFDEQEVSLSLYTYNIDSYNHKRTWNNPKNWANPEMWGKARW